MDREFELKEQLANLQSKVREAQQELQEIENEKGRNALRGFLQSLGINM